MFLVLPGLQRGREGRQREGEMEKKREETHRDPPWGRDQHLYLDVDLTLIWVCSATYKSCRINMAHGFVVRYGCKEIFLTVLNDQTLGCQVWISYAPIERFVLLFHHAPHSPCCSNWFWACPFWAKTINSKTCPDVPYDIKRKKTNQRIWTPQRGQYL